MRSRRPRFARTPAVIKMVREQVRRKFNCLVWKTAADLDASIEPYKKRQVHGLKEAKTKKKLDRTKLILLRYAGQEFMAKQSKHKMSNMDQFKKLVSKTWDEMSMYQVRVTCDSFEKRLKLAIKKKS